MEFFSSALEKYTVALLSQISADYSLPLDELVAKYHTTPLKKAKVERKPRTPKDPNAPPKPAKVAKEDRPICPSLTGKKTPCKNRCLPGSDKCHLHCVTLPTGEPKPPRAPRVPKAESEKVTKKSAKKSKVQPSHNHAPLVAPDAPCQLCDSHGDAMNPGAPSVQFESQSLQERLRAIIQSESEPETEAETEPEPKTPKKSKKAEVTPVPDAPMKAKPEPKTPKKAVKKLELEPVAPPAPIKVPKSASIEERMALILSEEPEEEEEGEPESPGAVRHRLIMAEKGLPVEYDEEEDEEDPDDAEMTEDEFEEEELLE
jgi:hypothetical protein